MNGYESVNGYEPMNEYECMNVKPATLLSRRTDYMCRCSVCPYTNACEFMNGFKCMMDINIRMD